MRRDIIILFLAALFALPCMAREPHRGYRGFVDLELDLGAFDFYDAAQDRQHEMQSFVGIATSHGYQFNDNFFAGIGIMLSCTSSMSYGNFPVFADFRYDATLGHFKPYADIRLGCNVAAPGLYFSPTVGHRFSCGRRANFNLGMGLMVLRIKDNDIDSHRCFFAVRLGFDF